MRRILYIFFLLSFIYPMESVKNLDIERFMGKWHVVSLIPNFAEKGCKNSYDIYTLNDDGTIDIQYYADKDGEPFRISQKGIIKDNINKSSWKIKFTSPWIPLYSAPYEVIILDQLNYEYMVVGYPGNDYGWIMSRTTNIDDGIYSDILNRLESEFNYNKNQFKKVIHDKPTENIIK